MSEPEAAMTKPSFWQTVRQGWGPYRRLYSYVKPYRLRFIIGLTFGIAFAVINNGAMPLVISRVTSAVFPSGTPTPQQLAHNTAALNSGPKLNAIILICMLIPAVMAARSLCAFANAY